MKFLFASDSFKGSLTSSRITELLTMAANEVFPGCECVGIPVADGGEGTVTAVINAVNGSTVSAAVHDPLMNIINAQYGVFEDKAIIEMAAASGLPLVPEKQRDPLNTSTFGTGELIRHALDRGCRNISVAIGGSATNDGGAGMPVPCPGGAPTYLERDPRRGVRQLRRPPGLRPGRGGPPRGGAQRREHDRLRAVCLGRV